MINERIFASSFPNFWQELLPLLTPSCVHLLNAGHEEHLINESGKEIEPVEVDEETRDTSVVSEFAYSLAREAFLRNIPVNEAFDDDDVRNNTQKAIFDFVNRYERLDVLPEASLNISELNEGLKLAIRYEAFARLHGGADKCIFQVPIKGCGFLHSCSADLVIKDYLVEIKTVQRPLAGKDIRQLVVYLALSSVTHPNTWHYIGFFNPRRATFHRFQTNELIDLISGGKSLVDLYTELLDFTCSSDVQLDSIF